MKLRKRYLIALPLLLVSCSTTKHLEAGEYRLARVTVVRTDARQHGLLPRKDVERFIRQKPASRVFGMAIPEAIYALANPADSSWWSGFLRSTGSAPTIFDTVQTAVSATNMELYMRSRGYFNARAEYGVRVNSKSRNAQVTYTLFQGEPYLVDTISYDLRDTLLARTIPGSEADLRVELDKPLDIVQLNSERIRIADWLQERGYYGFTIDRITFRADTTLGDRRAALTMVVSQSEDTDPNGETVRENNPLYRIGQIYLMPDYDPVAAMTDPAGYMHGMDTTNFRGLHILSHGTPTIRNRILRQAVNIHTDSLYRRSDVQRLYDNLTRLGYYSSASISFNEVPDDGDTYYYCPTDSTVRTQVHRLVATIQTTPVSRYSLTAQLEATANSNYYGIKPVIGIQDRNLFHGAEVLSINLSGGVEYYRISGDPNSPANSPYAYEVGISTSLAIPRFVVPFKIDPRHRIFNPRTRFELAANYQNRPEYHRAIFSGSMGYTWGVKQFSYVVRPIDVNLIRVTYIAPGFIESIINPYLQNSYRSQVLVGLSAGTLWQSKTGDKTVSLNYESAGNVIYAVKALSGTLSDSTLFNVPYAQYVRAETSYTQRIALGSGNDFKLVYRLLGGIGYAYGNSEHSSLPMDRLFYSGGTNSMRGWAIRTLGPGSVYSAAATFANQTGNIRLEANLELRYPIWGVVKGAWFCDVGNVWTAWVGNSQTEGVFRFDSFYKQLGFNTGIGLRFDLKYVVFRLDYGIRIYDPCATSNNWRFSLRSYNTALQLGIGYPF